MSKSEALRLREENMKRNAEFLESLGLPSIIADQTQHHIPSSSSSNQKAMKSQPSLIKGNQRQSVRQRAERDQRKNKEEKRKNSQNLRCLYCQNDPNGLQDHVFYDEKGLSRHQSSRKCSINKVIINKAFSNTSTQQTITRNVYRYEDEMFADLNSLAPSIEKEGSEGVYESTLISNEHPTSCINNFNELENNILIEDQNTSMEIELEELDSYNENTTELDNICSLYYKQQEKVFALIFGMKSISCISFEAFIDSVRENKAMFVDKNELICGKLYSLLSLNLSRNSANELLEIIDTVKASDWTIPRTYNGLSGCVTTEVEKTYKFKTLNIPWIDSWGMQAFPEFPSISIHYRSPIELISYLFIDPEIMYLWNEDILFKYVIKRTNDGEEIYSNLMNSPWARDTEIAINKRDANGYILPLIFYSDGVQVGTNTHHKVTTVICSTGNFSDSLLNKEFSKCVVAYLPNFNNYSKYDLQKHLVKTMKFSKSKAKKEIQKFELLVERTFWTTIVDEIKYCWENGVRLHTLGQGMRVFYPCISFFCGDDPSQHRICGLFEGICKHGCTYCNYPTINGGIYYPLNQNHSPRDIDTLIEACNEAELISIKISNNVEIDKDEKQKIKELTSQSVHPYKNPFHDAPMGVGGNIYKSSPPDLLHLFCSGLMKAVAGWTLTIIMSLNSQTGLNNNVSIFDSRIHEFPIVTNMPHLNWQTFKGGLMKFARKNKREKEQATGSFGGFRSSSFVSILMQVYHAIGFRDDVLPGIANFEFVTEKGKIKLGNVRAKVQNTIASILDSYFDCKRTEWTNALSEDFQNKLNNMYVHIKLLWELNQTTLNPFQSPKGNKMRNIHKHLHLPLYTKWLGSLSKIDTSTYESFHKISTTGIWEKTSRKNDSLFLEMTKKMMAVRHNRLKDFFCNVFTKDNNNYIAKLRKVPLNFVTFKPLTNQPAYEFYISKHDKRIYLEDNVCWGQICNLRCFSTDEQFYNKIMILEYEKLFEEQYGVKRSKQTGLYDYEMRFIKGFTYTSGEDSQMGEGTIYSTPKYKNNTNNSNSSDTPRYDFVFIDTKNNVLTLVRILVSFELRLRKTSCVVDKHDHTVEDETNDANAVEDETKICLLVQHLTRTHPKHEKHVTIGECYTWAHEENSVTEFSYDLITVQSILRPAFVVPDFHNAKKNSSYSDIFYVLDRKYFDRSEWEGPQVLSDRDYVYTIDQQNAYILANQTLSTLLTNKYKTSSTKKQNSNEMILNEYHYVPNDDDEVCESEDDSVWYSESEDEEDVGL